MAQNGFGSIEWGTLLDENDHDKVLGRLALDADSQLFYLRPANGERSQQLPWTSVAHYLAVAAIKYDNPKYEKSLVGYLQRLEEKSKQEQRHLAEKKQTDELIKQYEEDQTILKKTRRRAHSARIVWALACIGAIAFTFLLTIPAAPPAAAYPTIAGQGADYGVASSALSSSTYIEAMGSAQELFGVIVDNDVREVGQALTGESLIRENIMLSPQISEQPIHMRPLYYNKSTFYQSEPVVNDTDGGMTAVYLQNRSVYNQGLAPNELVLMMGSGITTITLAAPVTEVAQSAADAAKMIEDEQASALDDKHKTEDQANIPSTMPEGWIGFDYCDIDDTWVVGSYWYQRPAALGGGLARRVVVYDITQVKAQGSEGLKQMNPTQLNYQLYDASYYAPVVSRSKVTNGQFHWLGYMKQDKTGQQGFYIRKIGNTSDILAESGDNTFSTYDLTNSNSPISNYTLDGDYLFYEQEGAIWRANLSELQVQIDPVSRMRKVTKEIPTKICLTRDMKSTTTQDEQFRAQQLDAKAVPVPVAHYRVMKITTSQGLQYGIVFVDESTGNLVFAPCSAIIVSADSADALSTDSNTSSVQDQSQTEIDRLRRKDEGQGEYAHDYDVETARKQQESQQQQTEAAKATGVSVSARAGAARPWIDSETDGNGRPWTVAGDEPTLTRIIIAMASRKSSEVSILAFAVRGEQAIWLEEDNATGDRCVRISPVYYKNDAVREVIATGTDQSANTTTAKDTSSDAKQLFQQQQAQQQAQQQTQQGQQGQQTQQGQQSQQTQQTQRTQQGQQGQQTQQGQSQAPTQQQQQPQTQQQVQQTAQAPQVQQSSYPANQPQQTQPTGVLQQSQQR